MGLRLDVGHIAAVDWFRKIQTSGANGGVVYSTDDLMRKAVAYADRGKPKLDAGFEERNPNTYVLPALNLNADDGLRHGNCFGSEVRPTRANRMEPVRALDSRIDELSSSASLMVRRMEIPFFSASNCE